MYDIPNPNNQEKDNEDEEEEDIEASIQKELGDIKAAQTPKTRQAFTPVTTALDCLFFMKTMAPVEPGKLALKMCRDARDGTDPKYKRCRYINRLTPVITTDKATENGIERVARRVLGDSFTLVKGEDENEENEEEKVKKEQEHLNKDGVPSTVSTCLG